MAQVEAPRPLAEDDDRDAFDCGREAMNDWLRRHAWRNHAAGISRTSVLCEQKTNRILGYVTLSAAQIERAFLAKSHQRNKPDPVPVTLLGQLAVDIGHQRLGYARALLQFALMTSWRSSLDVGSFGVVTHPIDAEVRRFYASAGFQDLIGDPRGAMIIRMIDIQSNAPAHL